MKQGWEVKKLGEVCRVELGKTPHRGTAKYWDPKKISDNVWLSIADLPINGSLFVETSKEYVSDIAIERMKLVPRGTPLVSFKLTLGRIAIAGRDLYTNEAIAALYIHADSQLDRDYLLYSLNHFDWHAAKEGDVKVKGKTFNKAKLKEIPIPLPPLEEQKRIVAVLDEAFAGLETARTNAEVNLKNAEELFVSALEEKLDTIDVRSPVTLRLKDVTTKVGSGATPRGGSKSYKSSGVPLIRSLNVYDRKFNVKGLAHIDDHQAAALDNVTLQNNDVLLNITGASVARCCLVPQDYVGGRVNQHVSIIRIMPEIVIPELLVFILTSKRYKDSLLGIGESGGSTRQAITKSQIEDFKITVPQRLEQQEVLLSEIKQIEKLTKRSQSILEPKLETVQLLRQSLLQKAFAGELT